MTTSQFCLKIGKKKAAHRKQKPKKNDSSRKKEEKKRKDVDVRKNAQDIEDYGDE